MGIIYILTFIIISILLILVRKNEEKKNILREILITTILYTCYQAILCFILNIVQIPIKLEVIVLINIIISLGLIIKIIKEKQIQKYFIDKKDIIFILIIFILQLPFLYNQCGNLNSIKFYTTDAYVHFSAAREFSHYDTLLNKQETKDGISKNFMPFAYINEGLLMKATVEFIGEENLYKVFLFSECNIYLGTVFVIYFLLKDMIKEKWQNILLPIFTILCAFGYPLNCLYTGFHYLQIGVTLAITTILIMKDNKNKDKDYINLLLLNFGVMFSYNLFAPLVFGTQFLYWIINKICKKISIKQFLIYILVTLFVPGICGIIFYFFTGNTGETVTNPLIMEGYIHRNIWSNIILFVPFSIYAIIKDKKNDYGTCFGFCTILYALTLYSAWRQNLISSYYYCKIYYMLWPVLILMTVKGIIAFCNGSKERKNISILCTTSYIIIFLISFLSIEYVMNTQYMLEKESTKTIMQIYSLNRFMYKMENVFSKEEIETLQYVNKNLSFEDTLFVGIPMQERWIERMFDHSNREDIDVNDLPLEIQKWSDKHKYKYIVLYKDKNRCKQNLHLVNMEGSELIYENGKCEIRRN